MVFHEETIHRLVSSPDVSWQPLISHHVSLPDLTGQALFSLAVNKRFTAQKRLGSLAAWQLGSSTTRDGRSADCRGQSRHFISLGPMPDQAELGRISIYPSPIQA